MDLICLVLSLGVVFYAFKGYHFFSAPYTPELQRPVEPPIFNGVNRISNYSDNKYWMNN